MQMDIIVLQHGRTIRVSKKGTRRLYIVQQVQLG